MRAPKWAYPTLVLYQSPSQYSLGVLANIARWALQTPSSLQLPSSSENTTYALLRPMAATLRPPEKVRAGSYLLCRDERFEDDIRCERRALTGLCIDDDVVLVDENRDVFSASHP